MALNMEMASQRLAASGANSANNSKRADRDNSVNLRGELEGGRYTSVNGTVGRDGVISCNRRMRAVQSGIGTISMS